MIIRYSKLAMTGLILSACCFLNIANAGLITTYGFLTSDADTNFVTDTISGRMYTRFDAFNLSYANTLTAIGSGGAYDGWSIATATEAGDWYAAALGEATTPCSSAPVATYIDCGTLSDWEDGDFGISGRTHIFDYFAYIDESAIAPRTIGLGQIYAVSGRLSSIKNWSTIQELDGIPTINLLLFKDKTSVPEPSTWVIFALGMIGLASRRFKKQS
jgi:hypothetical protein